MLKFLICRCVWYQKSMSVCCDIVRKFETKFDGPTDIGFMLREKKITSCHSSNDTASSYTCVNYGDALREFAFKNAKKEEMKKHDNMHKNGS